MRLSLLLSYVLILILCACVDRIQFDIAKSNDYGIVIDGFISDQPGPYRVIISRAFDIESKGILKTNISVKHLIVSDDQGVSEELTEIKAGIYETKANGIRGQIGRAYKLRVELLNGSIYESVSDTILPARKMETVYFSYKNIPNIYGLTEQGFDIFASSPRGKNSSAQFMLSTIGTFQSETKPELSTGSCYMVNGRCNFIPPCTGLSNVNPFGSPAYERVGPCECCTCWYRIFNQKLILGDNLFFNDRGFERIKVDRIPLNGWIFMHKIHVEVRQLSLTNRSFRFWKAIRDQHDAVTSLFQPVSGRIPVNFNQVNGNESPLQGIFYATAVTSKSVVITRNDVPNLSMIPSINADGIGWISCLDLFPNASSLMPEFWND